MIRPARAGALLTSPAPAARRTARPSTTPRWMPMSPMRSRFPPANPPLSAAPIWSVHPARNTGGGTVTSYGNNIDSRDDGCTNNDLTVDVKYHGLLCIGNGRPWRYPKPAPEASNPESLIFKNSSATWSLLSKTCRQASTFPGRSSPVQGSSTTSAGLSRS